MARMAFESGCARRFAILSPTALITSMRPYEAILQALVEPNRPPDGKIAFEGRSAEGSTITI
jgi:hypothetical protein